MKKYTKDTKLSELMEKKETLELLAQFNVPCISCAFARFEMQKLALGDVCQMYGIDSTALLRELNRGKKIGKRK